jgi:hypothetical protein
MIRAMTPRQYETAIAAAELTQVGAARFFGADERTGRRWVSDGPPNSVAKMLRLMAALKMTATDVDALLAK